MVNEVLHCYLCINTRYHMLSLLVKKESRYGTVHYSTPAVEGSIACYASQTKPETVTLTKNTPQHMQLDWQRLLNQLHSKCLSAQEATHCIALLRWSL